MKSSQITAFVVLVAFFTIVFIGIGFGVSWTLAIVLVIPAYAMLGYTGYSSIHDEQTHPEWKPYLESEDHKIKELESEYRMSQRKAYTYAVGLILSMIALGAGLIALVVFLTIPNTPIPAGATFPAYEADNTPWYTIVGCMGAGVVAITWFFVGITYTRIGTGLSLIHEINLVEANTVDIINGLSAN